MRDESLPINQVIVGDVLDVLRTLPDECVDCVVTSPPYWGLRDYGTASWEGGDPECDHEREALESCGQLLDAESLAKKVVKDLQEDLDKQVLAKYPKLTEAEIKALVVEDKWLAAVEVSIEGEVNRLAQRLAGRVKELEERYARPLPELEREVEAFSEKVEGHLKKMGLVWG